MNSIPPIDLTPGTENCAIYLPAISTFYVKIVSKQQSFEFVPKDRIPKGFDRDVEGMNFLNPEQGYFVYKYGLYSAGHAQLDIPKGLEQESMIHTRDRKQTMLLGDSGGFQIGKGVLKFDWHDFEGPVSTKVRDQILNWLENTAEWSMMLDVPGWACDRNHSPKTGLKTFQDCLDKTCYNNEYFLKNRQGKTKFLNVLQGSDWDTAEQWYQCVKGFSDPAVWGKNAAEGWAFGGSNMCDMSVALKRLMVMREDGMLEGKDWIHFLGTAQLDWACYLTLIQRQLRKHINKNVTISFDCASPFISTAHGLVYTANQHTPKRWGVSTQKAFDNKALAGSDIPFPFESEIGRRLTAGDICYYAPGMLNKIGKEGKTSWDSFSYSLLMAHNVYQHIKAVQQANSLMDIECTKYKPNWRQWKKLKASDKSDEYSEWVPRNIIYFSQFVEELFNTKTRKEAFDMIDAAGSFLAELEGRRLAGGPSKNMFNNMFDVEEVTHKDEIDLENPEDEELRKLEEDLDE